MIDVKVDYSKIAKFDNVIRYSQHHHMEGWQIEIHQKDYILTFDFSCLADINDFIEDLYASYKTITQGMEQ